MQGPMDPTLKRTGLVLSLMDFRHKGKIDIHAGTIPNCDETQMKCSESIVIV